MAEYSYNELSKSVDYFANILLKMGVKKDDHVAILSMNSFNWIASFYAVIKIGAVAVLLNYISRHDDIVKAIKFTDCKYLLYGKYIADDNKLYVLLKEIGANLEKPEVLMRRVVFYTGEHSFARVRDEGGGKIVHQQNARDHTQCTYNGKWHTKFDAREFATHSRH